MANEENIAAGVFELRAEAGQFSAVVANAAEVAKRFERVVLDAFNKAGQAASQTDKVESSSKRYISAIEREALALERKTAALVLSAAEQRRAEAAGRGEGAAAEAAIAKLEKAENGYKSLSNTLQQVKDINVFGELLAKSQALGQVEKNVDNLTAALNRLEGEAKQAGAVRLSSARVDEDRTRDAADAAAFGVRVAEARKLSQAAEYVQFWTQALDEADAKEKELKEFNLFDQRRQEAVKLNQAAEYVQFWNSTLDNMEAKERELAAIPLFEKEKAAADKLRRAADATAAFTQLLDQLEAEEKKLASDNSFVTSLERRANAINRTQSELLELEAAERGVTAQAAPHIAALRAQERALGIYSAGARDARVQTNQMRTALSQLPMQFTDIFTSLAGGQNPLLVLIQQGGQIKDSFGGIGNALRGMAGAIAKAFTPVTVIVGGAIAALGTLGAAFVTGEKEAAAYRQALVLTGNAAGTTAGQLQATAEAVSRAVGTQGKAAEVIAQLAATGRVAGRDLGLLAEAAIRLEREGGPAVKDTVAAFAELGKAPTQGALKLNETTRFLTVSVLEQIRALEDQGKVVEAARVAQNAFATEGIARAKELESQLGTLERTTRSVTTFLKGMWDAAANVGRENKVDDAIQSLVEKLARLRGAQSNTAIANLGEFGRSLTGQSLGQQADEAQSVLVKLLQGKQTSEALAKQKADAGALTAEYDKAAKSIKKWGDESLTAAQKAQKAIEEYRREVQTFNTGRRQAGLPELSKAETDKAEKAITDSFIKGNKAIKERDGVLEAARAEAKKWADEIAGFQKIGDAATASTENLTKAEQALIEALQNPAWSTRSAGQQQATIAEYLAAQAKIEHGEAAKKLAKEIQSLADVENKMFSELSKSEADYQKGRLRALESEEAAVLGRVQSVRDEIEAMGVAEAQNISLSRAIEVVTLRRLEDARTVARNDPVLRDSLDYQIAKQRELITAMGSKEVAEANRKAAEDAARAWESAFQDVGDTMVDIIMEGGKDAADQLEALFKRLVLRPIIQSVVNQGLGAVAGALGGQGGVDAQGNPVMTGLSAASSLNTLYGYGQRAYGWWTGAGTAAAGSLGASTGAYTAMANSQTLAAYGVGSTGATTGAAGAAGAAGSSGGSAAGSSAGVYAIYAAIAIKSYQQAQKDYAEGFRREQSSEAMNEFQVLRPIFGAQNLVDQIYRSLGLDNRSAAVLSGSTHAARIFGQAPFKLEETGITGTLGQGGFAGEQFSTFKSKGGWLRDDDFETFTSQVSDALQNTLATASDTVYKQAIDYGKALGLPAEQLGSVSKAVRIVLTSENITELSKKYGEDLSKPFDELSDEGKRIAQTSEFSDAVKKDFDARMTAIGDALGSYADELVKGYADALRPLSVYGETTADTLLRVGSALASVNDVFDKLGLAALQASIDGGAAAVSLVGMFGDIGTLQQAAGGYLQAYYTDAERANLTTKELGKALAEVGLAVPETREAFRSLVSSQDLTTESGRSAFTVLMSVADAFASVTEAGRSADDILKERVELERDLLKLQGDTAELRARERAQIDESNRALFDQVRALEDRQALQSAIDSNVTKFMTPGQVTDYRYSTVARDLQSAGMFRDWADFGTTLKDATKDEIYAFASQFIELTDVSADAKIAMVEAAGALADLKNSAGAAADELPSLIAQFTASLRSSDLSPLSFTEQLGASRSLFDTTLAGAKAGNADARDNLIGNAQQYLEEARAFFGSSMEYANVFRRVTTELDAIGAPSADPQVQAIRDQVTQIEAMRNSIDGLSTDSGTKAEKQIELARSQIVELQNLVQSQSDTNTVLSAGNRALWDQLDALNSRVQRLLENAQLEATAPS